MSPSNPDPIIVAPQPGMQTIFMQSPETEVFYGGQAGGGKSFALVVDAMRYIEEPGYKAIIFRRVSDDLGDLVDMARRIYVPCGARLNETTRVFSWPNGARISFKHLQHLKHIYSHQGKEYDFIGFDELPQFPKLAYTYLFSRLRGINPKIVRYMRSTGNPDGEGLLWVKNRFYDVGPVLTTGYFKTFMDRDIKVPKGTPGSISRKFVPCIRAENKVLMDNDPEYENRLDQLPEDKKRALKEGLWTVMDKPNQLILTKWWEDAVNGVNDFINDGNYTIGADYGTYIGVDKSVEVLGIGNRPYRVTSYPTTKTTHFAAILAETARQVARYKVRIGVDCIGPGTGVGDELEEHHKLGRILERCTHKDPIYDAKYLGEIKFNNLRSQMCWKLKEDMQAGNIDLSAFQTEKGYFQDLNMLQEEAFAHTFRVYNGELIVIPKDELRKPENLGRSPDYFDALVVWNWTRRHHMAQSHDVDTEYQVDTYMKEWFQNTNEYNLDEAVYHDRGRDEAEYDD